MSDVFLTAEWRKLLMANYAVDPEIVKPYLPDKTELDIWNARCYVSLVSFMFVNTRVMGCSIPFHADFDEVNLRFYVRYKDNDVWKRGVVFIREFVPLRMVTLVANNLYQERYQTVPMNHQLQVTPEKLMLSYQWKKLRWHSFSVQALHDPKPIIEGSEEEFITQHFWGYCARRNILRNTRYSMNCGNRTASLTMRSMSILTIVMAASSASSILRRRPQCSLLKDLVFRYIKTGKSGEAVTSLVHSAFSYPHQVIKILN